MIADKLRKILARAERGSTAAERGTALHLLHELLAKHDLTMDDIIEPTTQRYWIRYKYPFEKSLLFQIIGYVIGESRFTWFHRKGKKAVGIDLTPIQYATVIEYWETYRKPLTDEIQKYVDSVFTAYILKHQLQAPCTGEEHTITPSPEELQRLRDILSGLNNIASPRRQIGG